jgi:quercetin dioxygenase-like cupin family protein
MPTPNKPLASTTGDVGELLETSQMTGGQRVVARITFSPGLLVIAPHYHPNQDERFDVMSGQLTYTFDGVKHVAGPGESVRLPRRLAHQHYSAGPEPAVAIQTVTPGLDFDYILEGIFGLGSESRALHGFDHFLQALVWLRKMQSKLLRAGVPEWIQYAAAIAVTPIAYRLGYRAVYQRFSGEEW